MTVRFTQYLFPDRRARPIGIEVEPEVQRQADELALAGWRFEIECHPERQDVHGDCCNDEGQLDKFLVPNGPRVPAAVAAMIAGAHRRWVEAGRPAAASDEGRRLVRQDGAN